MSCSLKYIPVVRLLGRCLATHTCNGIDHTHSRLCILHGTCHLCRCVTICPPKWSRKDLEHQDACRSSIEEPGVACYLLEGGSSGLKVHVNDIMWDDQPALSQLSQLSSLSNVAIFTYCAASLISRHSSHTFTELEIHSHITPFPYLVTPPLHLTSMQLHPSDC